ncbi:hypothetical protein C8J57DRAFT_1059903 [Mycena rebaudengoi]|nr:hypothetical protein C8J57DRAFT_1059903 [Mycena rebaudengoi]
MRESNFTFPAQNKACVCITSQLYDRRALDTSSALPLFNSLTHLTYLTSTSPRIREIMTMDGGLERLVRILHDFCVAPPPPASPSQLHGLLPPSYRPPAPVPTLNPPAGQFDKHAAYRFSLAFQCVVNIGVRGSEPIRSRVVQAGTLDVVGCILEAWLAGRGFAVGPSTSATGLPRGLEGGACGEEGGGGGGCVCRTDWGKRCGKSGWSCACALCSSCAAGSIDGALAVALVRYTDFWRQRCARARGPGI